MQKNQFLDWVARVLAVSGRALTMEDTQETIVEWDSLGSLLLLMRLEEDFGVVVDASEIERLRSLGQLYDLYIQRRSQP